MGAQPSRLKEEKNREPTEKERKEKAKKRGNTGQPRSVLPSASPRCTAQ